MSYPVEKFPAAQSSLKKANYEVIGAIGDVLNGATVDVSADSSVGVDYTAAVDYIDTAKTAQDTAKITGVAIASLQDFALVVANLATYLANMLAYVESSDLVYADQDKYSPPYDSTWSM